ncbi:MAG: DUF2155 domain-containing protein [Alphaproteobacteria bacterium]|nr:DUF2155 domain-containing protein [Alphaproteobacteria bacterium]
MFLTRPHAIGLLCLSLALAPNAALAARGVLLQGLDKTTARVSTIEAPFDKVVRFGSLEITALACDKKPPEELPESTAYLVIRDIRPDEGPVKLFRGWMFASSPALSALEHPVYDIWVLDCLEN